MSHIVFSYCVFSIPSSLGQFLSYFPVFHDLDTSDEYLISYFYKMPVNFDLSAVFSWWDWGYAFFDKEDHRRGLQYFISGGHDPSPAGDTILHHLVMAASVGFLHCILFVLLFFLRNWERSLMVCKYLFLLKLLLTGLASISQSCLKQLFLWCLSNDDFVCLSFLLHLLLRIVP